VDAETWWTCYQKLAFAYGKKTDKDQSDVFFTTLQNVPGPVMRLAVDKAIKGEAFFPNPATLRNYCDGAHKDISLPASACQQCNGNTWVEAGPILSHGLNYPNVVKRCPSCWVLAPVTHPADEHTGFSKFKRGS
jgi:hypothetical protein